MTSASDNETFDYVIVGAGSAGGLLASRLTERADVTVCLLEAGGEDRHPYIHIPAGFIRALGSKSLMWDFSTEAAENTAGRSVALPQGRVVGGSSSINGLIYNRGQPGDFDHWAELGNPGWSFDDVLPYFRRTERWTGPADPHYRGQEGKLTVAAQDWRLPLADAFIEGAASLGIPRVRDHNGRDYAGIGYYQRTVRGKRRESVATAFLRAARRRPNLDLRVKSHVLRVLLDGRRAVGVVYQRPDGSQAEVRARREVILSAGTVNTARLMQISGIGNPQVLADAGVAVNHALPGVGENLQDHYAVRMVARVRHARTINEIARPPRLWWEMAKWAAGAKSILNLGPSLIHVLWKSDEALPGPDLQCSFTPGSYREGYLGALDAFPGMTCGIYQQRPSSRGYVRIGSPDPRAMPRIQPNYLACELDQRAVIGGLRLVRRLLGAEALAPYNDGEVFPGVDTDTDDALLDFARRKGGTAYHLSGTSRMGRHDDPLAVVSPQLSVHGLEGLRIVDASVMPAIPSGNINAPTLMIAEKAADLILGR